MAQPDRKYFGTDGIRGRVGEPPVTPDFILKLGWALGRAIVDRKGPVARVLIGKDTRVSGYMLESALEAGLSAAGVDITLLGPMPTPAIAYLTRSSRASAGIVISASHNPFHDNGIKFFSPDGTKLSDSTESEIESLLEQPLISVASADLGKADRLSDAAGRYIEFCKNSVPDGFSLAGAKIALDCANGAAYQILPRVFSELGARVFVIGDRPDGFNINKGCGSTSLDALKQCVVENEAELGVALDGDGDRVILIDHLGNQVDGDGILYIIARHLKQSDSLKGGVVGTLMTNLGLERALLGLGIEFERTSVGDRHVLARLQQKHWLLGGETSGHILHLGKHSTGDGIIAALQVMVAIRDQSRSLNSQMQDLPVYPQKLLNVKLRTGAGVDPRRIIDAESVQQAVRTATNRLGGEGRIVLRPSGTEPLVRVMVEGPDAGLVDRLSREIADKVELAAG